MHLAPGAYLHGGGPLPPELVQVRLVDPLVDAIDGANHLGSVGVCLRPPSSGLRVSLGTRAQIIVDLLVRQLGSDGDRAGYTVASGSLEPGFSPAAVVIDVVLAQFSHLPSRLIRSHQPHRPERQ